MATLYDARFRALDSSGNPLVGATLTIYTANTTTPASIYTNAALTVAMSNPTVAPYASDAGGWFPQIFAAEGTTVDILLKNSSGVTVKTYEDVAFLGDASSDFERTVSGSGRIKITGSAGSVLIQAGDPSPDDTGGTLVLEGWNGSQLELLTLDGASVNVTGRFTEQSKKLDGTVYTAATSWTSASSVSIQLPEDPTNCRAYEVDIFDIVLASGSALNLRIAYDGVPTFKSGASDYAYGVIYHDGTTVNIANDEANSDIYLTPTLAALANKPATVHLRIICPDSGNDATMVAIQTRGWNTANNAPGVTTGHGSGIGSHGRPTHIQLRTTSGANMTGKYRVRPLRGFGD